MTVERNLSERTRKSYLSDLEQYRSFIEKQPLSAGDEGGIPADQIVIRSFLASLYRAKLRKVTISRKVAALRSFYRYLLREGKVTVQSGGPRAASPLREIHTRRPVGG